MKATMPTCLVAAVLMQAPCLADDTAHVQFLAFSKTDVEALGQIDKLEVTVDCSWITNLKNVPELYNIDMGYGMPTQNIFKAEPLLGAAAVTLAEWRGVIGVRVPPDADAKSCFAVTVKAEGRTGATRILRGKQLGFSG